MMSQQRDRRDSCASTRRDDLAIGSSDWLGLMCWMRSLAILSFAHWRYNQRPSILDSMRQTLRQILTAAYPGHSGRQNDAVPDSFFCSKTIVIRTVTLSATGSVVC